MMLVKVEHTCKKFHFFKSAIKYQQEILNDDAKSRIEINEIFPFPEERTFIQSAILSKMITTSREFDLLQTIEQEGNAHTCSY